MKRLLTISIFVVGISFVFFGCSGTDENKADQPAVNSGGIDESYVGDADAVIIEDFKQTPAEAKVQNELIEQLKDDDSLLGEGGLSTY